MRIAVTGASGLIGSALLPELRAAGHDVLTLVRRTPRADAEVAWDPQNGTVDEAGLAGVEAIVHLAGYNLGTRWTTAKKQLILGSRVDGTRLIAEAAARLSPRPAALVCASAIGFYGERGDDILTETEPRGDGFLAEVVEAWEAAAEPARSAGIRVVNLRQGLILSRAGGALARLVTPFRLGLGGPVGSGRQWWSWVALDDVVRAYLHVLERPLAGRLNVTAPDPVTNRVLVKAFGRALRRPSFAPFPAFAVEVVLGEMGRELLLTSQRVVPAGLIADGFHFRQPSLDGALAALFPG
jgi:uncharacterized protein (TIGR01777 family)